MAGQNFSVINNLNSLKSQNNLISSKAGINKSLSRMSSGLRLNKAGDDPASLAIANALKSDFTALSQGLRNANDGIAIVQIADGAMSGISSMLDRAASLATQAASDTVGEEEKKMLNTEYKELLSEIDRVSDTASFKGEKLFDSSGPVKKSVYVGDTQVQSSIGVSIAGSAGMSSSSMGLAETDLLTSESAAQALSAIKDAGHSLSSWRGALGAQENRISSSVEIIQVQSQNMRAAESTIRDLNMAEEVSGFLKNKILTESGMASTAQSNMSAKMVLALFS